MEESGALERGRLSDKTRTVEEVQRNDEGRKTDVWCYCVFVFWNLRDAPRGFMVFISRGGASIGSSGWVRTLPSLLAAARHRPRCFHVQGCRRGRSLPLHPARNGPRQLRHQGPPPLPSPIGQCRAQDPSNGSPDPCILGAQSWMLGQFGAEMLRRLCNQTQACASSILVNSQWKSPSIRGARSCCIRVPSHEDIDQTGNFRLFGADLPSLGFLFLGVDSGAAFGAKAGCCSRHRVESRWEMSPRCPLCIVQHPATSESPAKFDITIAPCPSFRRPSAADLGFEHGLIPALSTATETDGEHGAKRGAAALGPGSRCVQHDDGGTSAGNWQAKSRQKTPEEHTECGKPPPIANPDTERSAPENCPRTAITPRAHRLQPDHRGAHPRPVQRQPERCRSIPRASLGYSTDIIGRCSRQGTEHQCHQDQKSIQHQDEQPGRSPPSLGVPDTRIDGCARLASGGCHTRARFWGPPTDRRYR